MQLDGEGVLDLVIPFALCYLHLYCTAINHLDVNVASPASTPE